MAKARIQLAVLGGAVPPASRSLEWLVCKQVAASCLQFERDGIVVSTVDFEAAPMDLPWLAAIFVRTGEAAGFRERWAARAAQSAIEIRSLDSLDAPTLLAAAADCVASGLAQQREFAGNAALQVAAYRREFDRLQSAFSRLEAYTSQQGALRASEIFEYPPHLAKLASQSTVRQTLPVNSIGICAFALDLAAKPAAAEPLRVRLRTIETAQSLGEWSIATTVPLGWVQFALPVALDEAALSLELEIEWPADARGWALGLGAPHPYAELRARSDNESLEAPLAMRVFASLPGVRVAHPAGALRAHAAGRTVSELVDFERYANVVQVAMTPSQKELPLVGFDPSLGSITVHPARGHAATVARLAVPTAQRAWRVSARIHLAHESAQPVEFALALRPAASRSETENLADLTQPCAAFSGWKMLKGLERGRISAFIPNVRQPECRVYLLTRQAPETPDDFAWARFDDLTLEFPPAGLFDYPDA